VFDIFWPEKWHVFFIFHKEIKKRRGKKKPLGVLCILKKRLNHRGVLLGRLECGELMLFSNFIQTAKLQTIYMHYFVLNK